MARNAQKRYQKEANERELINYKKLTVIVDLVSCPILNHETKEKVKTKN